MSTFPGYNVFITKTSYLYRQLICGTNGSSSMSEDIYANDLKFAYSALKNYKFGANNDSLLKDYIIGMYQNLFPYHLHYEREFNIDAIIPTTWESFVSNFTQMIVVTSVCAFTDHLYGFQDIDTDSCINAEGKINALLAAIPAYSTMIAAIVLAPKVYDLLEKLLQNEELCKIIDNKLDDSLRDYSEDDLYKIYEKYYIDCFDNKLSGLELTLVSNFYIMYKKNGTVTELINKLKLLGLNLNEMSNDMLNDTGMGPYSNLVNHYVEKHKIDCIFEGDNYKVLVVMLAYALSYINSEKLNLAQVVHYFVVAYEFYDHCDVYHEKYKLLNMDSARSTKLRKIHEDLDKAITGIDFENVLKELYEALGYIVQTTKTSGDQGADLVVERDGIKTVIQAKYYSSSVGNSAVQEVVASKKIYGAEKAVVITNNSFTRSAIELANANEVQLIDGLELNALIDNLC